MGLRLFAPQLQRACQISQQASDLVKEGRFEGSGAPKSQIFIVWSSDPDTILVPSGENATELMRSLCAFTFLLNSSIVPARQASPHQFWPRRVDVRAQAHQNPRL